MILDGIIDQRAKILDGRKSPKYSSWIPKAHQRRLKAYSILDNYYYGMSQEVIEGLATSLYDNYNDSGIVKMIASKFSELTLHGFGLVPKDANIDYSNVAWWLDYCKIIDAFSTVEEYCSYLGDGAIKITYDTKKQSIIFVPVHPSALYPISDDELMLVYGTSAEIGDTRLSIEHYKMIDGKCMYREGIVDSQEVSRFGNALSPDILLKSNFVELPCSKIPVVHIPNGTTFEDGYGSSDFVNVIDTIDTYHQIITDKALGSRHCALPTIFLSGDHAFRTDASTGRVQMAYEPASLVDLGANGSASKISNSDALDMLSKEEASIFNKIVTGVGLTMAGIGLIEAVYQREFQLKLSYGPTLHTIERRRRARLPYYRNIFEIAGEMWEATNSATLLDWFGAAIKLDSIGFRFESLIPEDTDTKLSILANVKMNGGISTETYSKNAIAILGLDTTAEDEKQKMDTESSLVNLLDDVKADTTTPQQAL